MIEQPKIALVTGGSRRLGRNIAVRHNARYIANITAQRIEVSGGMNL